MGKAIITLDRSTNKLNHHPDAPVSPFIKWAGGKGQLLLQYKPLFPATFKRYFEPFLGGGAVFFRIKPRQAILSDINEELINAYAVIRDDVENLIDLLETHKNDKDYYYSIRRLTIGNSLPIDRASRFIFLNRTCYNGLYRVNTKGDFNVPFGRYKKPLIFNADNLRNVSKQIKNAEIISGDFETILTRAKKPDFIYLDPPYQPTSKTAHFTNYAQNGFGENEQQRLSEVFCNLSKLGCFLMLTNSDTSLVRELYADFNITLVNARRTINCKVNGRKNVKELVIRNYM